MRGDSDMLVVSALFIIIVVEGGNDGDGVGVVGTLIDVAVSPSTVMVPIEVECSETGNPTKLSSSSSSSLRNTLTMRGDSDMLVVSAALIIIIVASDGGNDGDRIGVVGTLIDVAVSPSTVMVPIEVECGETGNPTKFPSSSSS